MSGETTNTLSPHSQYPQASEWLTKLMRNAQAPAAIREDVERLKLYINAYLGVPARLPDLFSRTPPPNSIAHRIMTMPALTSDHVESACPTCGQKAIVDASQEKCPLCTKRMVVRHNRTNGQAFLGCTGYPTCRGTINISNLLLRKSEEAKRARQLSDEGLRRIEL